MASVDGEGYPRVFTALPLLKSFAKKRHSGTNIMEVKTGTIQ